MDGDGALGSLLRIGPEALTDQAEPVVGDVGRWSLSVVERPVLLSCV